MIALHGKTALVIGGSRGIGRAVAVLLARAGADVAITYRRRSAEAENNAGVWPPEEVPTGRLPTERWRSTMAANLDGVFYSTRAELGLMGAGGRIVLVSSTAGQRGEAGRADCAATQGAADQIAGPIRFLCSDLASHVTGEVLNVNGGSVLCG